MTRFTFSGAAAAAALVLSGAASAQSVKPRFLLILDTSGSMIWNSSDVETHGDGSTLHPGCDIDGNGLYDDSKLYQAKAALNDVIAGFGSAEFALERFNQRQLGQQSCTPPSSTGCANGNMCINEGGLGYCARNAGSSVDHDECSPPFTFTIASPGALTITAATAASPIRITTSANHNMETGDQVRITGMIANTNANGTWTVTRDNNTRFFLQGSTQNGSCNSAGACGGIAQPIAVTNTSPIRIRTAANHGLNTGDQAIISGVAGNTAANGRWTITRIDNTRFTLNGSAGNGTHTNGTGTGVGSAPPFDCLACAAPANDPVHVYYEGICTSDTALDGNGLVGFPPAGGSNYQSLLMWMDGVEDFPIGSNRELRGHGATPLGGSLRAGRDWLANNASAVGPAGTGGIVNADPQIACRSYNVILITDGQPTCTTSPAAEANAAAAALFNTTCTNGGVWDAGDARCEIGGSPSGTQRIRIKTYVLGFAVDAATLAVLDGIASAGGTGTATLATNQAELTARLGDIISGSIPVEKCDCADNTCDGQADESFPLKNQICTVGVGRCRRQGQYACNAAQNGVVCSSTPGGTCPATPLAPGTGVPEQCGAAPGCTAPDPADCQDDDCDGLVDENLSCTCASKPETCNNQDDDCNGATDDGIPSVSCGLNIGECRPGTTSCISDGMGGKVTQCNGATNPAPETCDNKDNDCDGITDSFGRACYPGATAGCTFSGGAWTCVGACQTGLESCTAGSFGACGNAVTPTTELACDGIDNDCDGATDEGFGIGNPCGPSGGACVQGTLTCTGGSVQCVGGTPPAAETCNSRDDDCNGITDDVGGACGSTLGECRAGTFRCVGTVLTCDQPFGPRPETCNSKDDDCDGAIDNPPMAGVGVACGTSVGECDPGTTRCVGGGIVCEGGTPARSESCNNKDDDCDGCTDCDMGCLAALTPPRTTCPVPGSGQACGSDVGECSPGGLLCVAGVVSCAGGTGPAANDVCDAKDNDCNGFTDESDPLAGSRCYPGATAGCTLPSTCVGECRFGANQCTTVSGSTAIRCVGPVTPVAELCDGKDNDCNGATDNGFDLGAACDNGGRGACLRTGTKICNANGSGTTCNVGPVSGSAESCDGIDNDCDGLTDNLVGPCGSTLGRCQPGTRRCVGGAEVCDQPNGPLPEVCNNVDDNCDGSIDNMLTDPDLGTACGSSVGICRPGVVRCIGGRKECHGGVNGSSEVCNNFDDDCDGCTDCDMPCLLALPVPKTTCPVPGTGQSCGTDVGLCDKGQLLCIMGSIQCSGGTAPRGEVCDGDDNNCNGFTDEDDPELGGRCYPTAEIGCDVGAGACVGECQFGGKICKPTAGSPPGAALECANPVTPKPEACDGKDNDCDGSTDEEWPVGVTCDNGATGLCKKTGVFICNARGDGVTCSVPPSPVSSEVCNARDDDCDGVIDNLPLPGVGIPCGSDVGECQAGQTVCDVAGRVVCSGDIGPTPEICNGLDDDCDGSVDEGVTPPGDQCPPPALPPGTPITGECRPGTYACTGKGGWMCRGFTGPFPEICDGKDNDCDGRIDMTAPCPSASSAKFGCVDGECVPECGTGEFRCPSDRTCKNNFCVPNPCAKVRCQPGFVCRVEGNTGVCKDLCEGVNCAPGATCERGVCKDCHDKGCPTGFFCAAHTCEKNPCSEKVCPDGQYCSGGNCVDSCAGVRCPVGESCHHGLCQPERCRAVPCSSTKFCDPSDGTCKSDPCQTIQCMPGLRCVKLTGKCELDPCRTTACGPNETCRVYPDGHAECNRDDVLPPRKPPTYFASTGGGGCVCTTGVGGNGAPTGPAPEAAIAILLGAATLLRARARRRS